MKIGMTFYTRANALKQTCLAKCGYYAWLPKSQLTKGEKKRFFGGEK